VWPWLDAAGQPVDLTGYSAAMDWATELGETVLSLRTGSGIVLGGAQGTISLTATAAQTGAVPAGAYAYDLFLTSPAGVVTRRRAGVVVVAGRVTGATPPAPGPAGWALDFGVPDYGTAAEAFL
jgi:hypothetical protein